MYREKKLYVFVHVLFRSIQKLEELNVGMENLGEEVKSLAQQCNGNGNTPASEDNNNPPSVTPEQTRTQGGGVLSSTPQCTMGGRTVPPPEESPVVPERYCVISLTYYTQVCCRVKFINNCVLCFILFVCFLGGGAVGTNIKEVGKVTRQAPCPEVKR